MEIFWIAMVLLIGLLQYAMPQLTRSDIFFSVTVAADFRDTAAARRILAAYRRGIVAVTLTALGFAFKVGANDAGLLGAGLLMLELLCTDAVFVVAHRRTFPFRATPRSGREASLETQPQMPGLIPLLVGPYLVLGAATLTLLLHWNEIPNPMPVHWDLVGNPNGWMPKTPTIFWMINAAYLLLCLVSTLVVVGVVNHSRRIAVTEVKAREESRFRWIGIGVMLAASYLVAVLAFLPLYPHITTMFGGLAALIAIMTVGALELVRRGQGGVRLLPAGANENVSDRTPDACWKWGMIYYNPDDPALMVEKRFGIGWTLNFAHRGARILMALIFLALAFSLSLPLLARL